MLLSGRAVGAWECMHRIALCLLGIEDRGGGAQFCAPRLCPVRGRPRRCISCTLQCSRPGQQPAPRRLLLTCAAARPAQVDIRAVNVGDATMSVLEIWGAEYQVRRGGGRTSAAQQAGGDRVDVLAAVLPCRRALQENDCLLIRPESREQLEAICARERCGMQVRCARRAHSSGGGCWGMREGGLCVGARGAASRGNEDTCRAKPNQRCAHYN